MKAVVVYESLFGNTATVARAIAAGLGPDVPALTTAEATGEAIADADLIVAGGPVFAFHLSSDRTRDSIREKPNPDMPAPDFSHPPIRDWLDALPPGTGRSAAFDTHMKGFGKGAPTIAKELEAKGYVRLAEPMGFLLHGKPSALKDGELDRARAWGAELAERLQTC